jgi:hypothetical protein
MPKRKDQCMYDMGNRMLFWKNDQGYEVSRKFFTLEFLMDFYNSLT